MTCRYHSVGYHTATADPHDRPFEFILTDEDLVKIKESKASHLIRHYGCEARPLFVLAVEVLDAERTESDYQSCLHHVGNLLRRDCTQIDYRLHKETDLSHQTDAVTIRGKYKTVVQGYT